MIFPAIFHDCPLPFAIFNAKKSIFTFVNNVNIYFDVLNLSAVLRALFFYKKSAQLRKSKVMVNL